MPRATPFRLNRTGLMLALISTAFAGQAQAAAGRVEFAIGPATVVGTDGRTRPAARGMELDTGDTVQTNNGRVQMRMTDGAFISLQPGTEFGIKDYKFEGKTDGSEGAFFSLLKGAMRTVTGLIGRVNRNRYQVTTPTATVGIRGTGGLIQVLQDGGTLIQGTSGIWFLANPAGTIDVPAGVSGLAPADPNQPPQETADVPTSGPAPLPPQEEFVQGDQTEPNGKTVITPPTTISLLQSGSGYAGVVAFGWFSNPEKLSLSSATGTFDAVGRLTEITDPIGQKFTADGTSITDFGNDGLIAWGRWTGNVTGLWNGDGLLTIDEIYTSDKGLHYVVGIPTPSMPTGTANYTLLGATQPTYVDGRTAPGTLTGSLAVDFGALTVATNLNVTMPDASFSIRGDSLITSGTAFFVGNGQTVLTCAGGGSGCSATVNGFFSGSSAERAGLGYHVSDFLGGNVIGAAAFQKQ
jgi:hypothetical protein